MKTLFFLNFSRIGVILVFVSGISSCVSNYDKINKDISVKEYFSPSKYGVKASDRVFSGNKVPRGGGYYVLGKPYRVMGKKYIPREYISYGDIGLASWYGSAFHGRLTANGEIYDIGYLSAAHPTLPLPCYVRITNLENGWSLVVRVNDRGPYHQNRIIDMSHAAAKVLKTENKGVAKVHIQYLGKAKLDGMDHKYLMSTITQYKHKVMLPIGCQYVDNVTNPSSFMKKKRSIFEDCRKNNELNRKSIFSRRNPKNIPLPYFSSISDKKRQNHNRGLPDNLIKKTIAIHMLSRQR